MVLLIVVLSTVSSVRAQSPDVIVGDLQGVANWGTDGSGKYAYTFGTTSCNMGDAELQWIGSTNQHPVIHESIFRLANDRIEQLGHSWLKHGFCALSGSLCGPCSATDCSTLGIGCSDPYTASRNGGQSGLGPKWEVNAATGYFPYPPSSPPYSGVIARRCQVDAVDIDPALNPGALYFAEGHYITPDDCSAGNGGNNASYRPCTFNASLNCSVTGSTHRQDPAIQAWQDNNPSVTLIPIDVANDGRLWLGYLVTDNGDGTWHYEYAIQNVNSDRCIGSVSVPVSSSVSILNAAFHDVDHHSGSIISSTDWPYGYDGAFATWQTEAYGVTQWANAIRFGSLYNFRFDASSPPLLGSITLGLFKPGTPSSVSLTVMVPTDVGGIEAPESLACSELNNDVALSWTNPVGYDTITILRAGTQIATLGGGATSYDDLDVAVGTYQYQVRGHIGGDHGIAACTVDVVGLPSPTGLNCSDVDGDAVLTWSNPFAYDSVLIERDGSLIATLPGSATTYSDLDLTNGVYDYAVIGVEGGNESSSTTCSVLILSGSSTGAVLVWDAPNALGAAEIAAELTAQGLTVTTVTDITGETLQAYAALFCALGIYGDNHQLTPNEGQQLADYLAVGGNVYIEGSDIWGFDPSTPFHDVDGIDGLADGTGDLSNLEGQNSGVGLDLSSIGVVSYTGQNAWIDHIDAADSDGGVIWTNPDVGYDCGVFYAPPTSGRVIGCSFQFAGIGGPTDRSLTMALYLDALGLTAPAVVPVESLACSISGQSVDLSWTNGDSYDAIRVFRDGSEIATLGGGATSYHDASPGVGAHNYQVYADIGPDSSAPASCNATVLPGAVTALSCSPGSGTVSLSWNNGSSFASVIVLRDGTQIAALAGSTTSYDDSSAGGGQHDYEVYGVDGGMDGASDTCAVDVTPQAISGLSCSAVGTDASLSWTNGEGYDSVVIERDGSVIATLAGGATSYTDTTAVGGQHSYSVHGVIDTLDGPSATCDVQVVPAAPSSLTCEADGADVTLEWSNGEAYDSIVVERDGSLIATLSGTATSFVDAGLAEGNYAYDVLGVVDGTDSDAAMCSVTVSLLIDFLRGDVNNDSTINIADPLSLLDYLFAGGSVTCADAADVNDSGAIDTADAIYELDYIFNGGAAPAPPFPSCGTDATRDGLDCVASSCP